jgi:hypothetical protein
VQSGDRAVLQLDSEVDTQDYGAFCMLHKPPSLSSSFLTCFYGKFSFSCNLYRVLQTTLYFTA